MQEHSDKSEIISAIVMVREELLKRKTLYDGFLASIESALAESRGIVSNYAVAKFVLERIIGEENEINY